MATGVLLTSFSSRRTPAAQRQTEQAMLEGAARGELHLHASSLGGAVVGLGAFHLEPGAIERDGVRVWRRRAGGRAVASGDGFVLLTLALPHRSALVASAPLALRPEQVMNRCVRGLLAWLRGLGVASIYPGLDTITVERRALGHLSFAETTSGPTLFQAVIALDGSFTSTQHLLDRLDPEGRVPARLVADDAVTMLARHAPGAYGPPGDRDMARLVADVATGYAGTFDLEVAELDPAVTMLLAETADGGEAPAPPPSIAGTTHTEHGLLGAVSATVRIVDDRVAALSLHGDYIAPDHLPDALRAAIEGGPATRAAVVAAVDHLLDGERGYLLGLAPDTLRRLVATAVSDAA